MTYFRARPWRGRKPGWASSAEMCAEAAWESIYNNTTPDPRWAKDPGSAWWEPGAAQVMNATADEIDVLARMQDEYVLDAYRRGVLAGTIEEHPDFPSTPAPSTPP